MAGRPGDRVEPSGLRFQLLGPVEIRRDGATVPLRGPQPRCVLAMLLLDRGHVVGVDRLMDALWADDPPRDARNLLQQHVSRLRKALSGLPDVELVTVGRQGYRLDVAPEAVDLYRFRSLVERARANADAQAAVDLFGEALSLWRGDPLGGTAGALLAQRMVPAVEEELLSATEGRIAARLRLGQHQDVVSQLTVLLAEHPLREGVAMLLMEALHGCGRTDEALAVFRDLRARIVEELGIEPSEAARDLHQAILEGRLAGGGAERVPLVPAQLPADVAAFVGRRNEVKQLRAELEHTSTTPPVVVVTGPPGTGKSTLTVHVAHQLRSRFPDGQLYAYLAGTRAEPVDPAEVLGGFLHALGMPADKVPRPPAQRVAAYRSLVADRRLLVVLDDARDAAQVRPLLPASEGCAVLVSSRSALTSLDATARVPLGMLDHADSVAMLASELDPARLHAEPSAADDVVRACGSLALALRVVGRRLATRPHLSVRALAEQLADERERLDELAVGDLDVRASIGLTYQQLDPDAACAFRLLGLVDGPDIGLTEAAALLDLPRRQARRRLELLLDAHLVECRDADRYRMHDLLRAYAQEQVEADERPEERVAALGRLAGSYALGLRNANHARAPGLTLARFERPIEVVAATFTGPDDATAWLDRERRNVVAAVRAACAAGAISAILAGRVAGAFSRYADAAGHLADISAVTEAAAELSRAEGDVFAEGLAMVSLGVVTMRRHGRAASAQHFRRAALLLRGTAMRDEASALNNLAVCTDLPDEGLHSLQRAHGVYETLGDARGMLTVLGNIADHHHRYGDHDRAVEMARRAVAQATDLDAPDLATLNQVTVVEALHALGRTDEASALAGETYERAESLGVGFLVALAATAYARILRDTDRPGEAIDRYERALAALRGAGARHDLATTTLELGDVLHALGQWERAEACWTSGLEILEGLDAPEAAAARERLDHHRPGTTLTRL